jgi:hypothetical protein
MSRHVSEFGESEGVEAGAEVARSIMLTKRYALLEQAEDDEREGDLERELAQRRGKGFNRPNVQNLENER